MEDDEDFRMMVDTIFDYIGRLLFSLRVVVSDNRDVGIEDVETQSISDQTKRKKSEREREKEIDYRFFWFLAYERGSTTREIFIAISLRHNERKKKKAECANENKRERERASKRKETNIQAKTKFDFLFFSVYMYINSAIDTNILWISISRNIAYSSDESYFLLLTDWQKSPTHNDVFFFFFMTETFSSTMSTMIDES